MVLREEPKDLLTWQVLGSDGDKLPLLVGGRKSSATKDQSKGLFQEFRGLKSKVFAFFGMLLAALFCFGYALGYHHGRQKKSSGGEIFFNSYNSALNAIEPLPKPITGSLTPKSERD